MLTLPQECLVYGLCGSNQGGPPLVHLPAVVTMMSAPGGNRSHEVEDYGFSAQLMSTCVGWHLSPSYVEIVTTSAGRCRTSMEIPGGVSSLGI